MDFRGEPMSGAALGHLGTPRTQASCRAPLQHTPHRGQGYGVCPTFVMHVPGPWVCTHIWASLYM